MSEFDAKKVLDLSIPKITAKLGDFTYAQLQELERGEKAKADARTNLLAPLQAEIAARVERCPGLALSDDSRSRIAQMAHEANAAYCAAIGDDSQLPWDDAPEWQRTSALAGVNFHIGAPDAGPSASHENWMVDKEAEGWKFGAVKDPDKKEHPCLVPFDELPTEQQAKDTLFRHVVHAAVPLLLEIERLQAEADAPAGELVPEGQSASGDTKAEHEFAKIEQISFCDAEGRTLFQITPKKGDLSLERRKAVYGEPVVLAREKKRVEVSQVVAIDRTGLPVSRIRLAVPLVGGGGKIATFPARHIAFNL